MNVEIYRHKGYLGRLVPLDVLISGKSVASIKTDELLSISLPDAEATLQVSMQGTVFSPIVRIAADSSRLKFECGTPFWVLLDFMSFCYLPMLNHRVFFLRQVGNA